METNSWLLLVYKMPPEPSGKRVAIWRKLKGLGSVYVQNGVCILPDSDTNRRQYKIILNEIQTGGGEGFLLAAEGLDRAQDENLINRFNEDRNAEYREFLGKCQDYITELDRETREKHFTYAELQENDEDLKKLKNWLAKIKSLDIFGAPTLLAAEQKLGHCERLLEEFARRVFDTENP